MDEQHVCVICDFPFTGYGHNPVPLADEGRACDNCNVLVVMERLQFSFQG